MDGCPVRLWSRCLHAAGAQSVAAAAAVGRNQRAESRDEGAFRPTLPQAPDVTRHLLHPSAHPHLASLHLPSWPGHKWPVALGGLPRVASSHARAGLPGHVSPHPVFAPQHSWSQGNLPQVRRLGVKTAGGARAAAPHWPSGLAPAPMWALLIRRCWPHWE